MDMSDSSDPHDHDAGSKRRAEVTFPFDRMCRRRFPRARWSDARQARFVPGRTASRRVGRWLAEMEAEADAYADFKGRDAFDFDPIESAYLELGRRAFESRLLVRALSATSSARFHIRDGTAT